MSVRTRMGDLSPDMAAELAGWDAYFDAPADRRQCKERDDQAQHWQHSVEWDQAFDQARRHALVGLGRDSDGWLYWPPFDAALEALAARERALREGCAKALRQAMVSNEYGPSEAGNEIILKALREALGPEESAKVKAALDNGEEG